MMDVHVNNICRAASHALYKIGQIRRYLDQPTTERLIHAFVTCRLDNCNSLLFALPETQISKLQRIQNSAARPFTLSKIRCHISPVLRDLHWLPIKSRIMFKILLLTFKCSRGLAPICTSKISYNITSPHAISVLAHNIFLLMFLHLLHHMDAVLFKMLLLNFGINYHIMLNQPKLLNSSNHR